MKLFRLLALMALACFVLPLAGCTTLSNLAAAYNTVKDATIPVSVAITAANTFDAIELTAGHVLEVCTPAARPAACNDAGLRTMKAAILAGRPLRTTIEASISADQPASASVYSKLETAITTLEASVNAFNAAN